MKSVYRYLNEVRDAIRDGRIEHAIWCIENAYCISNQADKRQVDLISELIREDEFSDALNNMRVSIRHIQDMLVHHDGLEDEEWLLVLTELSTTYSFVKFSERRNWRYDLPELSDLMKSIRLATNNFTKPELRLQLKAMRRYNPNPLPPPL